MIEFLTIGITLGLSAGLAPGPLLTLVISETLKHDIKAGIKVALAPIITDSPIALLTLFIFTSLSQHLEILGVISIAGGFLILQMAIQNLRVKGVKAEIKEKETDSMLKGILVNFLSPHPYLFWISVGSPIVTRAAETGLAAAFGFVACLYGLLVGSKIAVAVLVGKSRELLSGRIYIYIMRFLGLVLIVLAIMLFREGIGLLS